MRLPLILAALFAVVLNFSGIAVSDVSAQQRVCAGSCDEFGNPTYEGDPRGPNLRDDMRFPPDYRGPRNRRGDRWAVSPNPPSIDDPRLGSGPALPRSERRYRERRYSHRRFSQRRYHRSRHQQRSYRYRDDYRVVRSKRRHHRSNRRVRHVEPNFANRTEFCRNHREIRNGHKVNVRRCVWVRNDLLHRYRGH